MEGEEEWDEGAHGVVVPPLPPKVDPAAEHYPFCIVWAPLPFISWFFPFIGHVGICDSAGRIYDFEGTCLIGVDQMLFGNPAKYWDISRMCVPSFYRPLGETRAQEEWEEACRREVAEYDAALARVTKHFRKTQAYNLFSNNCHSFVGCVLRENPLTAGCWGAPRIAWGVLVHGRYISAGRFFRAHLPFLLLLGVVVALCLLVAL
ncbi:transmembrane protein 222 [Trypanosoma grayi]|uniref:transmembrane protein 222 n=1 Tax=Trypanosoma grayi TaxID=71804 RepID=UPI0004F44138|nr:transmembrane protein 222 [Trypanosoma grayi]KEG08468.1 transmembrane protein 222 [Trypanosoma grayi]